MVGLHIFQQPTDWWHRAHQCLSLIHIFIVSRLALALAVSLLGCSSLAARTCGPDALGTTRILEVGSEGGLETGLKTYPRSLPLGCLLYTSKQPHNRRRDKSRHQIDEQPQETTARGPEHRI